MSRRTTRSQTIGLENAPVYTLPIYRKSTPKRKSGQLLTPITNQLSENKSVSKGQSSVFKKTKIIQVVPVTSLKKSSSAFKTLPNDKLNSSAIHLREQQKTVEQNTLEAHPGTSRRMTRSQTVVLAKPPVIIGKRKSEPAKIRNQCSAKQSTPKRGTTNARTASATSPTPVTEETPENGTTSKKKSAVKAKTLTRDRSTSGTILVKGAGAPANASAAPVIQRRRSTLSASGEMSKRKEDFLSSTETPKVTRRRHTMNSLESTNEAIASSEDQGKSTYSSSGNAVTNATGEQSNVMERPTSTKSANRKSQSSANTTGTLVPSAKIKYKANETVFIKISDDLRQILIDDSKFVNAAKRLYQIPTGFNVADVVDEYVAMIGQNEASNSWNSGPMTSSTLFHGIVKYFDALIGRQLLYESEREQHLVILNNFPGMAMSKVYPPIYLLRLLVQLNKLLLFKNVTDETMKFSVDHLDKFMKYLSDNRSTFFNV